MWIEKIKYKNALISTYSLAKYENIMLSQISELICILKRFDNH